MDEPELKGVRSAPVPGFPGVRADENGNLWRRCGAGWEPFGNNPSGRLTFRSGGKKVTTTRYRLVCAAWHGRPRKGWAVRFRDGDPANLEASNLEWSRTRTGSPPKLTPWQVFNVRERALQGESFRSLAAEFKVDPQTIANVCRGHVPPRRHSPELKAEAVRLCRSGIKPDAVAVRLGLSRDVVYTALKRYRQESAREAARV